MRSGAFRRCRQPSALVFIVFSTMPIFAQDAPSSKKPGPVLDGLLSSFSVPWRELLKKPHDSEMRNLLSGVSVGWTVAYPLIRTPYQPGTGKGVQGTQDATNINGSASVKYTLMGAWSGSVSFNRYADQARRAPWNPDFTYVFGYDDWHPYTFSFTYANYGGNRLFPDRSKKEKFTNFEQGGFTLGYKFQLPHSLDRAISVQEGPAGFNAGYTVSPRYTDLKSNSDQTWKHHASLSFRYPVYSYWYATATMNYYPVAEQQQPWDPDFTYGFGYFDWHPGKLSVQYNNYSGNRFPWRSRGAHTGTFAWGGLSLSWGYGF
ncbi:MAG TPA: hypothetical protein VGJ09_11625 [Bryobacteraceae bacterium]